MGARTLASLRRVVQPEHLVREVFELERERILRLVVAARDDAHERLAVLSELVHEPQDLVLALATAAAMDALDVAQAPLERRPAAERFSVAVAVGARRGADLVYDFAGAVAREARGRRGHC